MQEELLPQESVNRLFGISTTSPVTEYIEQYDQLMVLHNNINQSLSNHITNNTIDDAYLQELKTQQQNIRTQTQNLTSIQIKLLVK